jgi:hypothetical protein
VLKNKKKRKSKIAETSQIRVESYGKQDNKVKDGNIDEKVKDGNIRRSEMARREGESWDERIIIETEKKETKRIFCA